jgi:hypothetical protein
MLDVPSRARGGARGAEGKWNVIDVKALRELHAKATRGEWRACHHWTAEPRCGCGEHRGYIWSGDGEHVIAQMGCEADEAGQAYPSPPEDEARANARLIAALHNAAPALFDAAEERDAILAARADAEAKFKAAGDSIDHGKAAHIYRLLALADDFDAAVKAGDLGEQGAADAVAIRVGAMALVGGGRCSFCQWVSEGLTTVEARDAAMQAHIRTCAKHPLAEVTRERDALRAENERLRAALEHVGHYLRECEPLLGDGGHEERVRIDALLGSGK